MHGIYYISHKKRLPTTTTPNPSLDSINSIKGEIPQNDTKKII